MKVYYWSPFISKVATITAVLNSVIAIKKFSKNSIEPVIINVAGEWNNFEDETKKENIKVINLTKSKILNNKNYIGLIKSRMIYIYVSLISFFPLIRLLKRDQPEYFLIHLITPVPLIINSLFSFKTKFILRISGFPQIKKNIFRYLFWKINLRNLNSITCPTEGTTKLFKNFNFIDPKKINTIYDPIINVNKILKQKTKSEKLDNKYGQFYVAIGRLTKQKNFSHLIEAFKEFNHNKQNKLLIVGEGEEKKILEKKITNNLLHNQIFLIGYKRNIYNYLMRSKCFILSSLWEDPGFVLIEAGFCNKFVISSNCKNGPTEILNNGENGILYISNDKDSLIQSLNKFEKMDEKEKYQKKLNLKKKTKEFTLFSHYKKISTLFT